MNNFISFMKKGTTDALVFISLSFSVRNSLNYSVVYSSSTMLVITSGSVASILVWYPGLKKIKLKPDFLAGSTFFVLSRHCFGYRVLFSQTVCFTSNRKLDISILEFF